MYKIVDFVKTFTLHCFPNSLSYLNTVSNAFARRFEYCLPRQTMAHSPLDLSSLQFKRILGYFVLHLVAHMSAVLCGGERADKRHRSNRILLRAFKDTRPAPCVLCLCFLSGFAETTQSNPLNIQARRC